MTLVLTLWFLGNATAKWKPFSIEQIFIHLANIYISRINSYFIRFFDLVLNNFSEILSLQLILHTIVFFFHCERNLSMHISAIELCIVVKETSCVHNELFALLFLFINSFLCKYTIACTFSSLFLSILKPGEY